MTKAYAIPFGICYTLYLRFKPSDLPLPNDASNIGVVSGVDIIKISFIPDFANVYNG